MPISQEGMSRTVTSAAFAEPSSYERQLPREDCTNVGSEGDDGCSAFRLGSWEMEIGCTIGDVGTGGGSGDGDGDAGVVWGNSVDSLAGKGLKSLHVPREILDTSYSVQQQHQYKELHSFCTFLNLRKHGGLIKP